MFHRIIIGNQIIALDEISSTNDYLMQLVKSGQVKQEGILITTKHQTQGKGQRGNSWQSEPGLNLTFSFLINTNVPADQQFVISKMVSIALLNSLAGLGLNDVRIKWPNDIYCGKRKIAGILIENIIRNQHLSHSIVGIGLNVNQKEFGDLESRATSLIIEKGGKILDLQFVLDQIINQLDPLYVKLKTTQNYRLFDEKYHESLFGLNELMIFRINEKLVEGRITGVDSSGKLSLKLGDDLCYFDLKEVSFVF